MKKILFGLNIALIAGLILTNSPARADLLSDKQQELKDIQKKITQQEETLSNIRKQTLTLDNQVKLLDQQITTAQLALEAIDAEVVTIGIEKNTINHDLVDLEEQALARRIDLKQAIRASYIYSQNNLIEIVLGSNSIADFWIRMEYINYIQNKITTNLQALKGIQESLSSKKAFLEDKNERLLDIRQQRTIEEQSLGIQVDAKNKIMKDLKLSETEYQGKLAESKAEAVAVEDAVATLIRQTPSTHPVGPLTLMWPIPYRTITATFRDPDYFKRFGLQHTGMDIACPQGTPITAPASGTVTKIVNGGAKGLSYLVINHDNGLATVYMHLSGFAVGNGARVSLGQVIGYSGGTPGTPGAGWLTTGPHLHFEVWYEGVLRNPLAYLIS
ncbi:MAG: peptidoglycan DD-metalloendopeptidase family protein [Patescibacteria group bacterium]